VSQKGRAEYCSKSYNIFGVMADMQQHTKSKGKTACLVIAQTKKEISKIE